MSNIIDLLKEYQLNIMFALSLICGMLAFFVLIIKTLIPSRKYIILALELCAMFLLMSERMAYYFRGDTSNVGYWAVRVSNFMVFALTLAIIFIFTLYLINLYHHEGGLKRTPLRLNISCLICILALIPLIISQFTGFYYTFDAQNRYHRSTGFAICYVIPLIILILDMSVVIQNYRRLGKHIRVPILLFSILPLVSSMIQMFTYGISLTSITLVGLVVVLYVFTLLDMNDMIERASRHELEIVREEQNNMHLLFEQTATALANAIDAKDKYTHGHSRRVAKYSVKVARSAGKNEKECEEIYFAALLHDVGKIGIKDSIINKEGKLTDEEYGAIKTHPVIGMQILSSISQSPYLSIGAHYHHERYDGHGYPAGLKGEDIPDIARIIAVADAYDAMTSKRSYRDPIPQQIVREEFVKGLGTQFDPIYGRIMIHLIDLDSEYLMRESEDASDGEAIGTLLCGPYRTTRSDGILLNDGIVHIRLTSYMSDERSDENIPSFVLFDSLDGRMHDSERKQRDLLYYEYATVHADGTVEQAGARNVRTRTNETAGAAAESKAMLHGEKINFDIEAMRYKDHVLIRLMNCYRFHEIILALPDSTRFCYLALTGKNCVIEDVDVAKTGESISEGYIPRIAEEITYIDVPQGDIPNVQVDGWRSDTSDSFEITDGMRISFHTMSLPTARLVWHCPFVVIFTSADGKINGKNYRELTVVRLDGEGWEEDDHAENRVHVSKLDTFTDWNDFKAKNKEGQDCELFFKIKKGQIDIASDFCGLSIRSVTTVTDEVPKLYAALTGDQCAITNIHINR
ncbi:HD-GYP domain-containing protein [Ruminococcus sp.]|uniref:HD-GYP domain-containing protein n=1 Tax=Ruminococcus sp. TaxID=41978 RepID=UPI0025FA5627|nr:HD-GYP domain-containing protein [Ruminococcus sp.]MCR4640131.1 HD-GYP domain-containing protein [Ruminococcus sp.]